MLVLQDNADVYGEVREEEEEDDEGEEAEMDATLRANVFEFFIHYFMICNFV